MKLKNPDNKLIRSFIDRWFAYKKQGNFLTKGNIERTFNRSDIHPNNLSEATRDCLLNMHFISKDALNAINSRSDTQLIKDHAMPNDWDGINVFARYEKAGIQKADILV